MLTKLYNKLRSSRIRPTILIKTFMKRRLFKKYAEIDGEIFLAAESDCAADKPGLIRIGSGCELHGKLQSMCGGTIEIGSNTCVFRHSIIGSVESIKIGSCVIISSHVHIYDNNNHPTSPEVRRQMCMEGFHTQAWRWEYSESKPIVIEDNVWIGEYAAVLKGVTIGEGSIVASHAVVVNDVPPYTIVAGNPARVVKRLERT